MNMQLIPAIDLLNGQCVRLERGNFNSIIEYSEKPIDIAKKYADIGVKQIHLVDLEGALKGQLMAYDLIEQIVYHSKAKIDAGGGIRNLEEIQRLFALGVDQVNIGTKIIENDPQILESLGKLDPSRIILCLDSNNGRVQTNAWLTSSQYSVEDLIKLNFERGFSNYMCTDIAKDGMLQGPAYDLYRDLRIKFPNIKLIASGGVANTADLENLDQVGVDAVIVGRAIYEGKISIDDLRRYAC